MLRVAFAVAGLAPPVSRAAFGKLFGEKLLDLSRGLDGSELAEDDAGPVRRKGRASGDVERVLTAGCFLGAPELIDSRVNVAGGGFGRLGSFAKDWRRKRGGGPGPRQGRPEEHESRGRFVYFDLGQLPLAFLWGAKKTELLQVPLRLS